jgi:5'-3' exonuclease
MAVLIIDGMSVFKTLNGQAAHLERGYAYSFMMQVTAAVKKFQPVGVVLCWEGGFGHRTELLPGYKSDRKPTPQVIVDERAEVQKLLKHLGVDQFYSPGHEADDMIAMLANTLPSEMIIMSADKDLLQLVNSRVSVYQKVRGAGVKTKRVLITHENFQELTGWRDPHMFLMAHCALGDSVDKIPKLAGVGEDVIHAYFMGVDVAPAKKAKLDAFYRDSEQFKLNHKLISLKEVVGIEFVRNAGEWSESDAYRQLESMGFRSFYEKFAEWIQPWEAARLDADVSTVP